MYSNTHHRNLIFPPYSQENAGGVGQTIKQLPKPGLKMPRYCCPVASYSSYSDTIVVYSCLLRLQTKRKCSEVFSKAQHLNRGIKVKLRPCLSFLLINECHLQKEETIAKVP